uniref:C-type lectin domain-containing protein n=1 Tax=Oryzias sinensis TaxID=183150 RepID=A0A8C7WSG7_9TELE
QGFSCKFFVSFFLFNSKYHIVNQPLNWTEAQTNCRQKYTDLATIENSEEMDQLINTTLSAGSSNNFWIGLYNEINYRWSDGFNGSFTGNSYNDRQICMVPYWHSDHYHWSDSSCSSLFPFFLAKYVLNSV